LLIPEEIYAGHYSIPVYLKGIYSLDNGEQLENKVIDCDKYMYIPF
jgi:hypothetical protein